MNVPWVALGAGLLCLAPLGLGGLIGLVVLVLQIATVVQKAAEPPTEDDGEYSLEQGREAGK
jgi:hypothetical protein